MLQWVVEAARQVSGASAVVVATPDDEILSFCSAAGFDCHRTRLDHPSGTDRLAEVAESLVVDFYVNVQGDEPLIPPSDISACAGPLLKDSAVEMSSLYTVCEEEELDNPAVVKVALALNGDALYFSRFAIPFARNPRVSPAFRHLGLYGYRRETLLRFACWKPTPLEQTESLEQLRFLENGVRIRMVEGQGTAVAVDTPEQAEQVRRLLAK